MLDALGFETRFEHKTIEVSFDVNIAGRCTKFVVIARC
jgi:hypothetical protein